MNLFTRTDIKYRVIFSFFQLLRSIRYGILMSVFGYVSHCQQTPTCGVFFMQKLKKRGFFRACIETTPRFFSCGVVKHASSTN